MERIKNVLLQHWLKDHIAFIFEMVGTAFTIAGSLLLALTAKDPNMLVIFPLYEVGSASLLYAYYRMQMVWSIILTSYFVVVNILGFLVALL
jgi:hypothetical protein